MAELAAPGSDEVSHPTLVGLHRYWDGKRGGRMMPARRDLDPSEIVKLLPYIYMVDVEHDPLRFRYRLIGTAICTFLGRDYTGRTVDEATYGKGEGLDRLLQLFTTVAETRAPVAYKGNIWYVSGREWRQVEALLMPLSHDGVTVDIIFAGYVSVGPIEPPAADAPASATFRIIPNPTIELRPATGGSR
jgi:hypothetical protein